MKKTLLFTITYIISCIAFGQTKTLVFYASTNATQAKILKDAALQGGRLFDTTENSAEINEANLKNYHAVVFLNVSVNALTFQQSADLQRFMQAGGGFVGIGAALEKNYKWLWYSKMIGGTMAENQLTESTQFSLITNASVGKSELPPLWKIADKPLIINNLSTRCKPSLLDVMGKTWAWYYTTTEGGKMFYTALGSELSAFQNPTFLLHIFGGIEEVSGKSLPDYTKIADSALPKEQFFLKRTLTDNLTFPVALASTPDRNIVVVEQNGNVKIFNTKKRRISTVGSIEATKLKAIKLDPEFATNGYLYTFLETVPDQYKIGRLQIIGDSAAVLSDFSSESTTPLVKNIAYDFDKYAQESYRLPKYFDKKTFVFNNEKGFILETYDDDGNLQNVEPFLPNNTFNFIQDMVFGDDGALYLLENNQLVCIDYSETNRKPVAMASADVVAGNAPLKVTFSSEGSVDYDANDALSFEWNIGGMMIIRDPNPVFTFPKAGSYEIRLKVTDSQGDSSESVLKILVNKAGAKKK